MHHQGLEATDYCFPRNTPLYYRVKGRIGHARHLIGRLAQGTWCSPLPRGSPGRRDACTTTDAWTPAMDGVRCHFRNEEKAAHESVFPAVLTF